MRKKLFLVIGGGLLIASCNTETSTADEITSVEYALDKDNTTLWWRGEENAEHFHYGHISITEGSLITENDIPVAGNFLIDANSIIAETEGYTDEKMQSLTRHLKDTAFLFTVKYPEIKVTTGAVANGKLDLTIDVLGAKLMNEVPVEIVRSEDGMVIKGDFAIDFANTQMPFITEVDPETGQPHAKSLIQFKLDLHLKKKK